MSSVNHNSGKICVQLCIPAFRFSITNICPHLYPPFFQAQSFQEPPLFLKVSIELKFLILVKYLTPTFARDHFPQADELLVLRLRADGPRPHRRRSVRGHASTQTTLVHQFYAILPPVCDLRNCSVSAFLRPKHADWSPFPVYRNFLRTRGSMTQVKEKNTISGVSWFRGVSRRGIAQANAHSQRKRK